MRGRVEFWALCRGEALEVGLQDAGKGVGCMRRVLGVGCVGAST
jgi:hypothetical protein